MGPSSPSTVVPLLAALLLAGCSRSSPPNPSRQSPLKVTRGFVLARAGSFVMGSPESELGRYTNESEHEVTLTRDFEISANEVTQAEFRALMGYNPSHFAGCPSCPVETVSWHEAAAYCNALSRRAGLASCYACQGTGPEVSCQAATAYAEGRIYDCPGYRLPTDAEWEYAYRAGTRTPYYTGAHEPRLSVSCVNVDPRSDLIGWYCANSSGKTHPVGQKKPNPWGLHDMAGNVWEWCHDKYQAVLGSARVTDPGGPPSSPMQVVRGGSWQYFARGLRAATRAWFKPGYRGPHHGFRPVRSGGR